MPRILRLLMDIIANDNEKNGVCAVKITHELLKMPSYRLTPEYTDEFFKIYRRMYGNFESIVNAVFSRVRLRTLHFLPL